MYSFININGSVCGPVTLSRGFKQGDSISSQLYVMSIEPLLMRMGNEPLFQGITLPLDDTIKLTAYADDLNVYVTQSSDINIINSILSTYQPVSNGKVNWTKSCRLKMNGWDVGLNCKLGMKYFILTEKQCNIINQKCIKLKYCHGDHIKTKKIVDSI